MKVTDAKEGKKSIGELWEALAKLSSHVVDDNKLYADDGYPLVRDMQLCTMKSFIKELDRHHNTDDNDKLASVLNKTEVSFGIERHVCQ
jgi:hypothetical protein